MGRTKSTGKVEPIQKIWLSTREACAYLDCSLDYLEALRNEAQVLFSQHRRMIWYDLASINRFLAKNKIG